MSKYTRICFNIKPKTTGQIVRTWKIYRANKQLFDTRFTQFLRKCFKSQVFFYHKIIINRLRKKKSQKYNSYYKNNFSCLFFEFTLQNVSIGSIWFTKKTHNTKFKKSTETGKWKWTLLQKEMFSIKYIFYLCTIQKKKWINRVYKRIFW